MKLRRLLRIPAGLLWLAARIIRDRVQKAVLDAEEGERRERHAGHR